MSEWVSNCHLDSIPRSGGTNFTNKEDNKMRDSLLRLQTKIQILLNDNGQDLIEYALVVALIAFAATVGMSTVASDINKAFSNIGTKLTAYTS